MIRIILWGVGDTCIEKATPVRILYRLGGFSYLKFFLFEIWLENFNKGFWDRGLKT